MPTMHSSVATCHYAVSVLAQEGLVEVRATDPDAKEVLWGWAGDYDSTKDAGAQALYGTEDWKARRPGERFELDHDPWRWSLNAVAYCSLRTSLLTGLADPKRYELGDAELALYRELLDTMDKALVAARRQGIQVLQR